MRCRWPPRTACWCWSSSTASVPGCWERTGRGRSPIILFTLAFGLSTDYEVFLLGRIREERACGSDDREAVAEGLARTGRIVTSAALLFCLAMAAMVLSRLTFVKELGFGTATAVLLDATVVRAVLVPALMMLLGSVNWWAPRILRARPTAAATPSAVTIDEEVTL
ncbi:MMPL family transporter [Nocardia sp. NPDC059239]|uniref:MMPL family transporter n=1 Tax=unclassified Nocardia TaxID=2637762 RepID=UPI0036D09A25